MNQSIDVYVKVSCEAHTSHRDPSGVYLVAVSSQVTDGERVSAAFRIVQESVAFLDENKHTAVLSAYDLSGIPIRPILVPECHEPHPGLFKGRAPVSDI